MNAHKIIYDVIYDAAGVGIVEIDGIPVQGEIVVEYCHMVCAVHFYSCIARKATWPAVSHCESTYINPVFWDMHNIPDSSTVNYRCIPILPA